MALTHRAQLIGSFHHLLGMSMDREVKNFRKTFISVHNGKSILRKLAEEASCQYTAGPFLA
jgi:hypothetical protein